MTVDNKRTDININEALVDTEVLAKELFYKVLPQPDAAWDGLPEDVRHKFHMAAAAAIDIIGAHIMASMERELAKMRDQTLADQSREVLNGMPFDIERTMSQINCLRGYSSAWRDTRKTLGWDG